MARTWSAVLARMGVPTGDGRILDPAGGSSRSLPLPLSWQRESDDGHGGSVVVGRIESMRFENGMVTATGTMLDSAEWSGEVMELLVAGVIGPSVDLDDVEYVMDADERVVLTKWRVAGATLVSIPAFADVSLTLDPLQAEPMEVTEGTPDAVQQASEAAFESFFASAAPEPLPPLDWFQRPDLDRLTPVTVSDTGRVFGHIAGWDTCHVGLPGCVTPPPSQSGYQFFTVSSQLTQEGVTVPVGTLVAGPRHADAQDAFRAAMEHYDDPAAAVARVTAGEDEFGIWVAGWMLPGARPEAVEVFTSSPVSGDWRRIGGSLELIAVCSVNAPGFPVPRARVNFASGAQHTLIASFGITPVSAQEENQVIAERDRAAGRKARPMTAEEGAMIGESLFVPMEADVRAKWAWTQAQEEI